MARGGVRERAGRKKMTDTVPVCWRISPQANEWIRKQAEEQGVTIARIVDELVKTFEEVVNGNIVLQGDQSNITFDFKTIEKCMEEGPDRNGYIFSHPREIVNQIIEQMKSNPAMIDRSSCQDL